MSVNSKARNSKTMHDIVYELKKENQLLHALLRDRKGFSSSETKPIGTSGGVSGSSGPSGFLRTEGDTMIGPIAFFPDLAIIDAVDDSINISKDAQLAYTSRAIVSAILSTNLETIHGAAFAGQLLMIQGILTETFTIKHGLGNIRTFDGGDIEIVDNQNVWLVFDSIANEWAAVGGSGSGSGTGLHISADLVADQTANVAVGNHVEFDRNAAPTGADGGIVLQTGAGQANGIFELLAGKTYFLSGAVSPIKSASVGVLLAWYDRTNAVELGRRTLYDESNAAFRDNQPKAEIIFTPATDVDVELRIVAFVGTSTNLTGFFAVSTYAHIFEFSGKNGADGAPGVSASISWKNAVRAKTLIDVPTLASFTVLTDGVTLIEGDRVLLTEQATASENGIYDVGVVAAGVAPLTRSSDFDADAEVVASSMVPVEEGVTFKNTVWQLITNNPITVGATAQVWQEFAPGSAGGPDLGGGSDGIDGAGFYVNDGRIAVAFDRLKRWEQISDFVYPNQFIRDLIYLPAQFTNPTSNGRVVMCGGNNFINRSSSYSDNYGGSWTGSIGGSNSYTYNRMAYDPVGDVMVMCADLGPTTPTANNTVKRSTDRATNWINTAIVSGTTLFRDVIWSAADSLFVMVAANTPTNAIWTSPDGNTWTQRTNAAPITVPAAGWTRITYAPALGLYLVVCGTGNDVMTSPDAITWTVTDISTTTPSSIGQKRLIWSEGQGKFVIPSTNGKVYISKDGINWTENTVPGAPVLQDIVYAPDLSLFLILEGQGTSPRMFWASHDAESWTQFPLSLSMRSNLGSIFGTQTNKGGIAYAEEWGYFFACGGGPQGGSGTSNGVFFRTDVHFNNQFSA